MSEHLGSAPESRAEEERAATGKKPSGRLGLELVALRGKDVIGVRHLVNGAAWVGMVTHSLARISTTDFGGLPLMVGQVQGAIFTVHVPPRARARVHGADGIPRLLVGPYRVELREGERAVLVLGPVQIRAQVMPFDAAAGRRGTIAAACAGVLALVCLALLVAPALFPEIHELLRTHETSVEQPSR